MDVYRSFFIDVSLAFYPSLFIILSLTAKDFELHAQPDIVTMLSFPLIRMSRSHISAD